jgi:ADP-heptose:LPS heptosyltransferase
MSPRTIVVLRALGLGDLLTGIPALRALREAYPEAHITLAAPSVLVPLCELSDSVDGVADFDWVRGPAPEPRYRALPRHLHGADLAVDLHGRGPESTRLLLAARPRRFVGFAHPDVRETRGLPRWTPQEHEVTRWCRLLAGCGIPADPAPSRLTLRPPAVASPAPGAVVVHPGAGSPARRWPARRWAEVARLLSGDGWPVVVTGSRAERGLAERVAALAGLPPASVLAGRTSLTELAALTAGAALVLSGDTGMAHLSAAYGKRAVTLAGPVPPRLWGPPPRPWHVVLWAGRRGDPHAEKPDRGLLELEPFDVLGAARRVLEVPVARRTAFACPRLAEQRRDGSLSGDRPGSA